jgi:hypothetical protein
VCMRDRWNGREVKARKALVRAEARSDAMPLEAPNAAFGHLWFEQPLQQLTRRPAFTIGLIAQLAGKSLDRGQPQFGKHQAKPTVAASSWASLMTPFPEARRTMPASAALRQRRELSSGAVQAAKPVRKCLEIRQFGSSLPACSCSSSSGESGFVTIGGRCQQADDGLAHVAFGKLRTEVFPGLPIDRAREDVVAKHHPSGKGPPACA